MASLSRFEGLLRDIGAEYEQLRARNSDLRAQVDRLTSEWNNVGTWQPGQVDPERPNVSAPTLRESGQAQVLAGPKGAWSPEAVPMATTHKAAPKATPKSDGGSPSRCDGVSVTAPEAEPKDLSPQASQLSSLPCKARRSDSNVAKAAHTTPTKLMRMPKNFKELVTCGLFEFVFAVLIMMNCLVMALEVQYQGIDIGYYLRYPGYKLPAAETWRGAQDAFYILDVIFGSVFAVEVIAKTVILRREFFAHAWNLFDAVIVSFWVVDKSTGLSFIVNPMALRVARLFRIVRLVKKAKTFKAFEGLHLLIGSISASFAILFWAIALILVCQMAMALLLASVMEPYMLDDRQDRVKREDVYKYYGTFTRSLLTMFELTLANWIPATRVLAENVGEWWGLVMVIYKMIMGFAVIQVITGVFMHETMNVASSDNELMVVKKNRAMKGHFKRMERFFKATDINGNGGMSRMEFKDIMKKPEVKVWFAAMDLEVGDPDVFFTFIDNNADNQVSLEELVHGVNRLRGGARSMDVAVLLRKVSWIEDTLQHRS